MKRLISTIALTVILSSCGMEMVEKVPATRKNEYVFLKLGQRVAILDGYYTGCVGRISEIQDDEFEVTLINSPIIPDKLEIIRCELGTVIYQVRKTELQPF